MSVALALGRQLPPQSISPLRFDASNFCGFDDFDALPFSVREMVVADAQEACRLGDAEIVLGHFCLPTLRMVAPLEAISTLLREPRARLLSLYAYWAVEDLSFVHPYDAYLSASEPLGDFLMNAEVAAVVDNQVCRMLLFGDRRIPVDGFIAPGDAHSLADDCVALLDRFGFVGVQERPQTAWAGLSRFFGVSLEPERVNVTSALPGTQRCPSIRGTIGPDVLATIEARTAVDRRIYAEFRRREVGDAVVATRLADAAYARQLVEIGATLGGAAAVVAGSR